MTKDDFHKDPTNPSLPPDHHLVNASDIPKIIGSYKIEGLFEKGGMSVLYLGTDIHTNEPAIIKVLSKKYLLNEEVVKRFLKEADIIAMTDHSNIVKLYGHGTFEGGLYMALEFVQGISLRQYILQKHISLKRALEMIIEISYALCHLHMHGVIHRDLKPENILVTESDKTKMIDFGIAQLLTESIENNPLSQSHLIGTPIYMSPEQKQNPSSVSYPSDIYSLAIIAYELILGKLSYGQIHLGLMPKGLRKILTKALQPDPKLRYQDVVDFIADISGYLNSDAMKQEQNVKDQLLDLSENLKGTQKILVPEKAPYWKGLDIGIITNKDVSLFGFRQGLYQDFFEIPNDQYGIIMSEASLKNNETIIYTSAVRGMIRALCKLTSEPSELVAILNDLIVSDPLCHNLSLSYVTIDQAHNTLQYIACGDGKLCFLVQNSKKLKKIINQNILIGLEPFFEFSSTEETFNPQETLCLLSYSGALLNNSLSSKQLEEELSKSLIENIDLPAEPLTENILKKLKVIFSKTIYDSLISLIIIKRKA